MELDDADKSAPWQPNPQRELPAPRGQFSRKDRRDVLARSLEDKSAKPRSGVSDCFGTRGVQQGAKLAAWRGAGANADSSESLLEDSRENPWNVRHRPVWARTTQFGAHADNGNYQRACRARARLGVLADAALLDGRRRATQSAFPAAGLCRRPVPSALPRARRTSRASTRWWWLFSLCPIKGLTAIPMPECRNRAPPRPNPGCTSSPRGRYLSSSFPLTALRLKLFVCRRSQRRHCGNTNQTSCFSLDTPTMRFVVASNPGRGGCTAGSYGTDKEHDG